MHRSRGAEGEVAQIMYTHVSKCKNNKIKFKFKKRKHWQGEERSSQNRVLSNTAIVTAK
jgi:CRISPR/Cas system-associated endonuclease Cas1